VPGGRRGKQSAQSVGERAALIGVEGGEQLAFTVQQGDEGGVHPLPPERGQAHPHEPTVGRVGPAGDQPAQHEPVEATGHGPGGDMGQCRELTRGPLERFAAATQHRQDVEFVSLQAVLHEGRRPPLVEHRGQPGDAGEHLQRLDVEIGAFALPGRDDVVDLVIATVGHEAMVPYLLISRYRAGMRWDPEQYARFADERSRPFFDLLARVGAVHPRRVVDLGCGPGTLTAVLAERWPDAVVEGLDSSAEMIARATASGSSRVAFRVGDVAEWTMPADTDVVLSNATLQWVPHHRELLASWAGTLPPDGWLAVQVPDNFSAPSHALMRSLASSPPWADALAGVLRHDDAVGSPESYADVLLGAGLQVDVWTTTYLHLLPGDDPVLDWVRGTGLRPVLGALAPDEAPAFEQQYAALLRAAYPKRQHGTILPFRRIFAVGHRASL
jgi:trans-aconitate 2-methyltransferase